MSSVDYATKERVKINRRLGEKRCSRCRLWKTYSAYTGRKNRCNECNAAVKRTRFAELKGKPYHRYREKIVARRKKAVAQNYRRLFEYFLKHPCSCGESDPMVLEFDHVRGQKEADISALVNRDYGWERILREIKKCVVRCANCHRRATQKRGKFVRHQLFIKWLRAA